VPSGRRYLPGTMILETTCAVPTGWAVVRIALIKAVMRLIAEDERIASERAMPLAPRPRERSDWMTATR
jgi:alpha,alpha-trehalase